MCFDQTQSTPTAPSDPFAPPAMSFTEAILRAAGSALPPPGQLRVANTTGGHLFGLGARIGSGLARVYGENMAAQRLDPFNRQLALAQQIAQQGTQAPPMPLPPQLSGGPTMPVPPQVGEQTPFPEPVTPPAPPTYAPGTFSLERLQQVNPGLAAVAPMISPQFDPYKQAQIQATQAEVPLRAAQAKRLEAETAMEQAKLAGTYLTPEERERARIKGLYDQFAQEVQGELGAGAKNSEDAANRVLDRNPAKYAELPANSLLVAAAKEQRGADRAQAAADRREKERLAAEERHFNRQLALEREKLDTTPASGTYVDKETGEIRGVLKGELSKQPSRFKQLGTQQVQTLELLNNTFPIVDRMEELVPKVLAKNRGKQLPTIMANYAAHKMGYDPDVQELMQLGTGLSVEQARALGGSSRVLGSMFSAIRGEAVPGLTVTQETAKRMLNTGRQEVQNRINSIVGKPLQKITQPEGTTAPAGPNAANPYSNMSDAELKKLLSQ
jgi:hypothetical protein